MELTQNYDIGIIERLRRDRAFAEAMLTEVEETLGNGEYATAQELLRVLVLGTVGFGGLSRSLSMTAKKLQEVLETPSPSVSGQLSAIAKALKLALGVAAS